jgi:hypothetical protein
MRLGCRFDFMRFVCLWAYLLRRLSQHFFIFLFCKQPQLNNMLQASIMFEDTRLLSS